MKIRSFRSIDRPAILKLWQNCGLVVPQNNPEKDIERKLKVNPEWFLVGVIEEELMASCIAGYDGHRGWIYYLAVAPKYQRKGFAGQMMQIAEELLKAAGCAKINLQVRDTNLKVIEFYKSIGYSKDKVVSFGKRLEFDDLK